MINVKLPQEVTLDHVTHDGLTISIVFRPMYSKGFNYAY